jgi:HEAT repeat protein
MPNDKLESIKTLIHYLESSDQELRSTAITKLNAIGEIAVPFLIDGLKGSNNQNKQYAIVAILGDIGVAAVPPLLQAFKDRDNHKNIFLAEFAALALGKIKDVQAFEVLLQAVQNKEEPSNIRRNAAFALWQLGDKRAIEFFRALLLDTTEGIEIRIIATKALGELGDVESFELLASLLASEVTDMRDAALWALGELGDRRIVDLLVSNLTDTDINMSAGSAVALGKIGDEKAIAPLIDTLKNDEVDKTVQIFVVSTLSMFRDNRVTEVLIETLSNSWYQLREEAAYALGRLKAQQAVPMLTLLLADEDLQVRLAVASALAEIKEA